MFKIHLLVVKKFNQNVVVRCLPFNFKHAYQSSFVYPSSFFISRASPKQNVLEIAIVTLLYWSKDIPDLIILMSTFFLPPHICSHYLPTCFLRVLLIGNMNLCVLEYVPLDVMAIVVVASCPFGGPPQNLK
jgi:hypothetical protein